MLTIIIRAIIIYVLVLFVFRIMGKRQIGQMQPFELVLTLILADLATVPMSEINIPILHGIVPLLTLLVLHYLITLISKISPSFSSLISGKPVIVINEKGVDYTAIKKLNITIDDLFESIREKGFFSFNDVLFAIMETNGKIAILPKISSTPATKTDILPNATENTQQVPLIFEGKMMQENIKQLNISQKPILSYLQKRNIPLKQVLLLTSNKNGDVYFQEYYKQYKIEKVEWRN